MSKLKDKLTANIQMVKTNQQAQAAQSDKTASDKPLAKPAAKPAAAPSKAAARAGASATPVGGDISPGPRVLFPSRVWPD